MTGSEAFAYALLRAVPSIARGEAINVGVVVHCRRLSFLAARTEADEQRLCAVAPGMDVSAVAAHLALIERVAAGDGPNPVAALERSERFGWITAPSSTVLQPSAVHTGLTADAQTTLDELFDSLVRPPSV